jgi:hypothetical protein
MIGISATLMSALSSQLVGAAPGDYINLSEGGTMSFGVEISIDLETGLLTKRTAPPPGMGSPNGAKPQIHETRRQLAAEQLQNLKETIRRDLVEGLVSKACQEVDKAVQEGRKLPTPQPLYVDYIRVLTVRLDGQMGHSPRPGCESPAFGDLWDTAYRSAQSEGPYVE